MFTSEISSSHGTIDVRGISAGIYLVRLKGSMDFRKFVKN